MADPDAAHWIQLLVLGGLAGAAGQAARTIVGIKKVNDQAAATGVDAGDLIVASRLFISLTIGFVAGALAALFLNQDAGTFSLQQVVGLAAAGYAGTDFIEGIISKVTPATPTSSSPQTATPPSPPLSGNAITPISPGTTGALQAALLTTAHGKEGTMDSGN